MTLSYSESLLPKVGAEAGAGAAAAAAGCSGRVANNPALVALEAELAVGAGVANSTDL